MSGPEDFKLGGKHNAGDPEGRRVMTDKESVTDEQTVAELTSKIEYWGNAPLDTSGDELARRYEDWFIALRAALAHPPTGAEPNTGADSLSQGGGAHASETDNPLVAGEALPFPVLPTSAEPVAPDVEAMCEELDPPMTLQHPRSVPKRAIAMLRSLSKEIQNVRDVSEARVNQIAGLQTIIDGLDARIESLSKERQEFADKDRRKTAEYNILVQENRSLSKDAATVRSLSVENNDLRIGRKETDQAFVEMRKQIDSLSKELADLQHDMSGYMDANTQYVNEIEALSRDAERYRWLRKNRASGTWAMIFDENLELYIDAALVAKEGT